MSKQYLCPLLLLYGRDSASALPAVVLSLMMSMVQTAQTHLLDYLLVLPLDEEAAGYYGHLNPGFVSLSDGSLILPVEVMRQALGSALQDDEGSA